jgi:predicted MFS family arabinose efflux permease
VPLTALRPPHLVGIVCLAEILGMTPFSMFLALQTELRDQWRLSNTEVGWISSGYYAGYMAAVPVLSSLTDRIDARIVWLASTTLAAIAAAGFGFFADGLATALAFQVLAGASLAGTYMPGLKLITDRVRGLPHPRYVAFYTTSFTIGAAVSFLAIGQLVQAAPWRAAIVLAAGGPIVAWCLVWAALPPVQSVAREQPAAGRHWRTVLRAPEPMRYVVGYACHTWELFGVRSWLVPFLTFCAVRHGPAVASPATLAAAIALVGVPASIAGAELTTRVEPRRLIVLVMLASAAASVVAGASSAFSWTFVLAAAVVHSALIGADSAALTAGLVTVSPPEVRGTTMAIYSMVGFAAASAGSAAVGAALDALGGESVRNWTIAFGMLGAANVVSVFVLQEHKRPRT